MVREGDGEEVLRKKGRWPGIWMLMVDSLLANDPDEFPDHTEVMRRV